MKIFSSSGGSHYAVPVTKPIKNRSPKKVGSQEPGFDDWLAPNPDARSSVEQGLADAAAGRIGDFPPGLLGRTVEHGGSDNPRMD